MFLSFLQDNLMQKNKQIKIIFNIYHTFDNSLENPITFNDKFAKTIHSVIMTLCFIELPIKSYKQKLKLNFIDIDLVSL